VGVVKIGAVTQNNAKRYIIVNTKAFFYYNYFFFNLLFVIFYFNFLYFYEHSVNVIKAERKIKSFITTFSLRFQSFDFIVFKDNLSFQKKICQL